MDGTNRQDLLACSLFRMADHERPAKSKRRSYVCRNCQREFDRASRLKTHEAKCSNKRQRFEVKSHYEVYESIDDMGDNSENEDIMEADSGSDGSDEFDSHEHDWKGKKSVIEQNSRNSQTKTFYILQSLVIALVNGLHSKTLPKPHWSIASS